jgi:hypothetical protein
VIDARAAEVVGAAEPPVCDSGRLDVINATIDARPETWT